MSAPPKWRGQADADANGSAVRVTRIGNGVGLDRSVAMSSQSLAELARGLGTLATRLSDSGLRDHCIDDPTLDDLTALENVHQSHPDGN